MTTWQNYSANSGKATTTWNYNPYRGWLDNKRYADNTGPTYTYSAAGRLQTRLWARGITTTYSYNNAGDLSGVTYSDGTTAGVAYAYDRRGRQNSIIEGSTTTTRTLNDAGELLIEAYSGGTLNGLSVTNGYDQFLRRTNLSAFNGSTRLLQHSYSYGPASRLDTVSDGTNSATYGYVANSPLVDHINFANAGTLRMVTTKQWDWLNRLTSIVSTTNGSPVASFAYQYNSANQRTARSDVDSSYWQYGYDALGQVTSGKKFWPDGTPVAGQQFEYSFDDIGNRTSTRQGGDQWGANLRSANYTANNLNQYTSRTVPGFANVLGSAASNATVTVSSDSAPVAQTYRRSDYFRAELPINNSTGAVWLSLTNRAVIHNGTNSDAVSNIVGNLFIPQTAETFLSDADGNLIRDGRWTNSWDGENRLISVVSLTNTPSASKRRLTFGYDSQWRRISKTVETWTGSAWSVTLSNKFLYDGWNLITELNATNDVPLRCFAWGIDLSGGFRGAGGTGGFVLTSDQAGITGQSSTYFASCTGSGDIAALVRTSDSECRDRLEYGPFGEDVTVVGSMANATPIRYSSKYKDPQTDLIYFGARFLQPTKGRWLSRDPEGEAGGLNPLAFVCNDTQDNVDREGGGMFSLNTGGVNAPPVTGTLQAYVNTGTDPSSAYELGFDWLTGISAPVRNFTGPDPMAQQMSQTFEAYRARNELRDLLRSGCKVGLSVPFYRNLRGESKLLYPLGFLGDVTGHNPARAFTGSFFGTATVTACWACCAAVKFSYSETKGWESATRFPPPLGYPDPGTGQPARSLFPNNAFGNFGKNITVNVSWNETICPSGSSMHLP